MNPTQLSPSGLESLLVEAFDLNEPVTVTGKPGVGKTAIVQQAAKRIGYDFIKSHPALDDPTDGKGIPDFEGTGKNRRAVFTPIGQFERVLRSTRPTVWLLDDFLQAPDSVRKTYMQWLHGRECAGHVLPEHVRMVLATNDRTHKSGAGGMEEALKSRTTIVELVENLDDWATWLFGVDDIDGTVISDDLKAEQVAFLKLTPDAFCEFNPNLDLKNSPNPRTWAKALRWMTRTMPDDLLLAALGGVVGEGRAVERMGFRRMYRELPTIEGILQNPDASPLPTQPSVLYAVARALAAKANKGNIAKVIRYAERLHEASRSDFAALMLRDATHRDADLQRTPEFVMMLVGDLGALIGGIR